MHLSQLETHRIDSKLEIFIGKKLRSIKHFYLGVVSGAILMIKSDPIFDLTTQEIEAVVGITVGVACLFSLLGGWLNKSIGRRWTIIISSVLFGIGSINLGIAKTLWELLLGRAIIGAGLGIASMSVPIYLSECAPTAYRGMIVTINNLSITGGQLVAALTCGALSGVDEGWRWMLGLALAPAIIQMLGFIFILPEVSLMSSSSGKL